MAKVNKNSEGESIKNTTNTHEPRTRTLGGDESRLFGLYVVVKGVKLYLVNSERRDNDGFFSLSRNLCHAKLFSDKAEACLYGDRIFFDAGLEFTLTTVSCAYEDVGQPE